MKEVKKNSLRAWLLAMRPKTLTGALVPVILGTALASSDGQLDIAAACLCAVFACVMQIAANFINDLFDFLKGSDRADRLGPKRACAEGWISPAAMKRGILLTVVLGVCTGVALLIYTAPALPLGGWELIVIGIACVAGAFLYTLRLAYMGWGDLLVLLFFGLVPVGATYYVQAHALTANSLVLGLAAGLAVDTLLVVNNYRDREQDAISGKRTLIVRFGEPFGRYLYLLMGLLAGLLPLWFVVEGKLHFNEYLWTMGIYLALHMLTWKELANIRQGKELNAVLGETSRNMLIFALLLAIVLY